MKLIQTRPNCAGCTKCERRCPVKAISIVNGLAVCDEKLCVLCGECVTACPQGSLYYISDLARVKSMIEAGRRVVVSISPAYYGAWGAFEGRQVIAALKKAGIFAVHETSEAANAIIEEYAQFASISAMNTIITSQCPSINELIETYYPDLIPCLAPVETPITAHGKYLKNKYGQDTFVVYVGPCFAQKGETVLPENRGTVDAVLTFKELHRFINQMGVHISDLPPKHTDNEDSGISMLYVSNGGIVNALRANPVFPDKLFNGVHISGMANCMHVLEEIRKGYYNNCVVEMHVCPGGCVNGPARPKGSSGTKNTLFLDRDFRKESFHTEQALEFLKTTSIGHEFINRSLSCEMPSEEEINRVLCSIGRDNSLKQLDCGGCGYQTCRQNAIAILRGRSTRDTCIQYLHEQAASLSNLVMSVTPNYIMILDRELKIREFSKSCERVFKMTREEALGREIIELMDDSDFLECFEKKGEIRNRICELREQGRIVKENIIYIPSADSVYVMLVDITDQKRQEEAVYQEKLRVAKVAQDVINKQMMTAQTIAGLLGETTADTKVALNKMIKSLIGEEEGR